MAEIINITNIWGKLLKTVSNLHKNRNIIITRNYKPVAVLVNIKEYEKK